MEQEIIFKQTKKLNKKVIDEILDINKNEGLTSENIVERAKDKSNPLHNFFEWDNKKAGEKFRLAQASIIMNQVKVQIEDKEIYAFESVNISNNQDGSRAWKPIYEILDNKNYREQIIKSALSHLEYWRSKYSQYNELKPIEKAIVQVKKKQEKKWLKKKQ